MPVKPLDTLLAIKALGLIEGLSVSDRRVGAILIEHFNRRTGQCDPGIARISQLLGVSERTVIRCTKRLEGHGLVRKIRHGGFGNRNSYEPVWSRFVEVQTSWRAKMKRRFKSDVTEESPLISHSCHFAGDSAVTQTCSTNTTQLTYPSGLPKKRLSGKSSSVAARDEAERRWITAVTDRFRSSPITYGEVIAAITIEISEAATDAELQRPGAGLDHIVRKLKLG